MMFFQKQVRPPKNIYSITFNKNVYWLKNKTDQREVLELFIHILKEKKKFVHLLILLICSTEFKYKYVIKVTLCWTWQLNSVETHE